MSGEYWGQVSKDKVESARRATVMDAAALGLELEKAGRGYKGKCTCGAVVVVAPGIGERGVGLFYCTSNDKSASGDPIQLLRHAGLRFSDAVELLAGPANAHGTPPLDSEGSEATDAPAIGEATDGDRSGCVKCGGPAVGTDTCGACRAKALG